MALTRLELGELYYTKGGVLERRFLGSILHMSQQIKGGGVADPTAEQIAWADFLIGQDLNGHLTEARKAMEWGLINNSTMQSAGVDLPDGDMDWIVKEYAKTHA